MIFDKMDDVRVYLLSTYPKSRGKTMAGWTTSDVSMSVGVYEDGELMEGLIIYKDENRDKWVLLDNFHADLATRNFIEYREEFDEAIALFELLESMDDEEEDIFFETLD